MKRLFPIIVFITFLFASLPGSAQESKHIDISVNTLDLVLLETITFSAEKALRKKSSIGLSVLINMDGEAKEEDLYDYNQRLAITPYYRFYLRHKQTQGLFLEAFSMFNRATYNYPQGNTSNITSEKTEYNAMAIGAALGIKLINEKNLTCEILLGIGKNIVKSNHAKQDGLVPQTIFVPRVGISIGKRF